MTFSSFLRYGPIFQPKPRSNSAGQRHAATIKKPAERAQTAIIKSTGSTLPNTLAVTRQTNAANVLLMQYSVLELTKDPSALKDLEQTVKTILPDVANKLSHEGTLAFYDFESVLEKNDAEKLIKEVKLSYPNVCPLDVDLIVGLHATIQKGDIGYDLFY